MGIVIAVARLYPAEVIVHYHCLNDRVVKNPPPVGASIARPPAAAGKQFGLRAEVIVIAVARPVAMAIILFPAYRRTDGQWPPLQCYSGRECKNNYFRYYRSGSCKYDTHDLNPNCPSGEERIAPPAGAG